MALKKGLVPLDMKLVMPPKLPALLYWIVVEAPPGEPLPAEGVAQVPSPRQKVVLLAPVPLLRLLGKRLPVTSFVRLTALQDGGPAALPCKTVVVVPRPTGVEGAAPAPPPSTIADAVSKADES